MTPRTRSRMILVLLMVLFAAPLAVAIALHSAGWEPARTRNHGELLQPPIDLNDLSLRRADAGAYEWEPRARRWRVVVVPPGDCEQACAELIEGLDKVWQLQGRRADRLDVLWFGALPRDAVSFRRLFVMRPDDTLSARLKGFGDADSLPVYLIDPRGFLVMRYPPGFDVAGLREDVARLLK